MVRENLFDRFRSWLGLIDADSLPPELEKVVDDTERFILRHPPRSDAEALMVAEVLVENIRTGSRPDGLDVVAARNLQGWLSRDLPGAKRGTRGYAKIALVT